VFIGTMMSEAI